MKKYKPVRIYPKILETKSRFTKEEKEHLTRKGLRWYIYYSFRHPITNKFERQPILHGSLNRDYPNFDDRLAEIKFMQETLSNELKNGYNPFEQIDKPQYTLISALEFGLEQKKNEIGVRALDSYKIAVKRLKEWLEKNGYELLPVQKVDKKIINLFLNHIAKTKTNRSRNNYLNSLSSVFTKLVELDYIPVNFLKDIKKLPAEPKRDPTYSEKQVNDILNYLRENDKVMLMFIYFVSYLFWRPKENCRIKVKDVNLEDRRITVPETKTKGLKTKLIPDIIYNDLAEYIKGSDPEDLLFTPNGTGKWDRELDGRRSVFTTRYRELKKVMGIEGKYTIYSFRHSFITKLYKNLIKDHPKEIALQLCAQITGHTSKAMLDYIHYADMDLPEDYSHLLK